MNSLIKAVAIAVVLSAPVASFAQSNQPVTRAEVRSQLVQLENAGYRPTGDHASYPDQIQAAERLVGIRRSRSSGVGIYRLAFALLWSLTSQIGEPLATHPVANIVC
jgi:hypothetical protein